MTKTEARVQAKALRKNLDLHAIGAAMTQQLFALPAWRQAGTVFCFVSMRDEPDTTAILQQALVSGKRLCVPRCLLGNDGRMELVEITSLNDLEQAGGQAGGQGAANALLFLFYPIFRQYFTGGKGNIPFVCGQRGKDQCLRAEQKLGAGLPKAGNGCVRKFRRVFLHSAGANGHPG